MMLDRCHPVAAAVYFLVMAGLTMFLMDPVILTLSLAGALVCQGLYGPSSGKGVGWMALIFLGVALINPLVSHNGRTVLFVLGDAPITLEACLYGLASAAMVAAVLGWSRGFVGIMSSDKLLCLFGRLSPSLALTLSMALRYVPLFSRQARRVFHAQRALGLRGEDTLVDRARGGMRVFSILVTWALENGIITADSMAARGYGAGRRTQASPFSWRRGDALLIALSLTLGLCAALASAERGFRFYPEVRASACTLGMALGYVGYGILAALPGILKGGEAIKWHCLRSGI